MKIQILLVILWLAEFQCKSHKYAFKEKFYWGVPDFQFPNASARRVALSTGSYIPNKNTLWAMAVWNDKIFVSVYRFGLGVASSFNYFPLDSASKSPILIPYPSFDANYVSEDPNQRTVAAPSDSSIINSGYFRIDKCDRLWVVDAGFTDFLGNLRVVTPPAIVLFDLKTNELLLRYTIPAEFVATNSFFVNLDVDIKENCCDNAHAYIVDLFRSIVVFSLKKKRSWRLTHNFLGSDPHDGHFIMDGVNFQWNFGVLGITIGETHNDGSKRVYLSALASRKAYYISNKVLQNEAYIALNNYFYDIRLLGSRGKKGQMYTWEYDETTNVLFGAEFYKRQITCWNTANKYTNSNRPVVYKKKEFFEEVCIDRNRNLWVLSNNLPTFLYGAFDPNAKNVRMVKGHIDDIIKGTACV